MKMFRDFPGEILAKIFRDSRLADVTFSPLPIGAPEMNSRPRLLDSSAALAAIAGLALSGSAWAGDVVWDNGSSNSLWDTVSLNWSGQAWNNSAGDGAVFDVNGIGPIGVPGPITVRSMDFRVGGYGLSGAGPITLTSAGSSTLGAGAVSVVTGATVTSSVPIGGSTVGLWKLGEGTLVLGASNPITGTVTDFFTGNVPANVQLGTMGVGFPAPGLSGGTLALNPSSLPTNTVVRVVRGNLDIGSNNITLGGLTFTNLVTAMGDAAVTGTGTLRVTGDIHILGAPTMSNGGAGATIFTPVDIGSGTQVVRVGSGPSINLNNACRFLAPISGSGSLLLTIGLNQNGLVTSSDGISLYANNTYTGATILNGRTSVATGTSASTSMTVYGGSMALQAADGSFLAAPTIRVLSGGLLSLANNTAVTIGTPTFPAAQNNNRIRDDAAIELRDGRFTSVGLAGAAATETYGSLNLSGGHNILTITPNGGGTADLIATGNLTMAPRATLAVSSTALGAAAGVYFDGTIPAPDATGILPRVVGSADFLTYDLVNGLTPYTGYATDFLTPGTNVAVAAASNVPASVAINALKTTGTFTTTIGAADMLGVSSGMVLSASGTSTLAGGTLAFGGTPGVFFGTNIVNSAITGTQGLIAAAGTLTLAGDLSGLSGPMTVSSGQVNLNTASFAGPIEVRLATLKPGVSLTGAGGAITLGIPSQDPDLIPSQQPTLDFSAAAVTTIDRNIIVDNGLQTAGGLPLPFGLGAKFTPLSNSSGSQTLSGTITLNSPLNLQGGGGGGAGATNFTGTISGPAVFYIPNGRVNFTAGSTLSNAGGLVIGNQGNTMQVSFMGTAAGAAPMTIIGGNNNVVRYAGPGSLFSGPITFQNSPTTTAPRVAPLATSTINNPLNLNSDVIPVVAGGITATWAGPITGEGALSKVTVTTAGVTDNTGTLILSSPLNTYQGALTVGAGTLVVNGGFPRATAAVNTGAVLSGSGSVGNACTVAAGGTLAPGNSTGVFGVGNFTLSGALACDLDLGGAMAADLVNVSGTVTLDPTSALNVAAVNAGSPMTGTFIIVQNDGADAVTGTFGGVTGLPAGFSGTVNYAYSGTDSLGRVGDGNDIAITVAPSCYVNCDLSTQPPILNVNDFICFQTKFAAGDPYANCDGSTVPPVLNVNDFLCFLTKYAVGCTR